MKITKNDYIVVDMKGSLHLVKVTDVTKKKGDIYSEGRVIEINYTNDSIRFNLGNVTSKALRYIDIWIEPHVDGANLPYQMGTLHWFRYLSNENKSLLNKVFEAVHKVFLLNKIKLKPLVFEVRSVSPLQVQKKPKTSGNVVVIRGKFSDFEETLVSVLYELSKIIWADILTDKDRAVWSYRHEKQVDIQHFTQDHLTKLIDYCANTQKLDEHMLHSLMFDLIADKLLRTKGYARTETLILLKEKPDFVRKLIHDNPICIKTNPKYNKLELTTPKLMFALYLSRYWVFGGGPKIEGYCKKQFKRIYSFDFLFSKEKEKV
jgi:hypothetical protein